MDDIIYQCIKCGWCGYIENMLEDDEIDEEGVHWWSKYICPDCLTWWDLGDYRILENA